ncbi:hypothetical protein [Bailinhaonella thermotolerans]|uniref:Uncharacterized protein n=1 Tax=Bailinhaonella thermotolerans TaxID=1070861 RepID=A0A3A4APG1_9ACTN|nr:hypothetical protein [Bailinhaonella thermotolerans]RJL21229.1 hypothetical protein D5H75_37825 [Bailinhaonella thermotolerans]
MKFHLNVHVGDAPQDADAKIVNLTPAAGAPLEEAVIEALEKSGLTPADLRSRTLFTVGEGVDSRTAIAAYAALCGFARRRIDAEAGGVVLQLSELHQQMVGRPDAGVPDARPLWAQTGAAHPVLPAVPEVGMNPSPEDVTIIRHSGRVRMVPPEHVALALVTFVIVAALRVRGRGDRLPTLSTGAEPEPEGVETTDQGVDLEGLRRRASALRQDLRTAGNRDEIAPAAPITQRQRLLARANAWPIAEVMVRLGAESDPDGELWHCPRPERHLNGDQNPSMRLRDGQARCDKCDKGVPVGPLALVQDALGVSADEARAWLESGARRPPLSRHAAHAA